jgi:NAD(P)-dependent dehydrogenase (short-subunit alcohol dehydrogenase family)
LLTIPDEWQYAILKNLASDPSNTVIGLVRNRKAAEDRLAKDNISAHVVTADIVDEGALKLAAEEAQKILGDRGLDVLVNNAALIGGSDSLKSLKDLYVPPFPAFRSLFQSP